MGQLQEKRKAKVSLIILAAFIHLWSSDYLMLTYVSGEVMWHGSRLYRVLTGPLAFLKTEGVVLPPLVRPHC